MTTSVCFKGTYIRTQYTHNTRLPTKVVFEILDHGHLHPSKFGQSAAGPHRAYAVVMSDHVLNIQSDGTKMSNVLGNDAHYDCPTER